MATKQSIPYSRCNTALVSYLTYHCPKSIIIHLSEVGGFRHYLANDTMVSLAPRALPQNTLPVVHTQTQYVHITFLEDIKFSQCTIVVCVHKRVFLHHRKEYSTYLDSNVFPWQRTAQLEARPVSTIPQSQCTGVMNVQLNTIICLYNKGFLNLHKAATEHTM